MYDTLRMDALSKMNPIFEGRQHYNPMSKHKDIYIHTCGKVESIVKRWETEHNNKFVVLFFMIRGFGAPRHYWFVTKNLKYIKIEQDSLTDATSIDDEGTLPFSGEVDESCIARLKARYAQLDYTKTGIHNIPSFCISTSLGNGGLYAVEVVLTECITIKDETEQIRTSIKNTVEMIIKHTPAPEIRKIANDIAESDNQKLKSELLKGIIQENPTDLIDHYTAFIRDKLCEKLNSLVISELLIKE